MNLSGLDKDSVFFSWKYYDDEDGKPPILVALTVIVFCTNASAVCRAE
jgi:hypothetical protein